ncbi:MAG: SMP-30/gluconolactonase/LRE family protein [Planctomycetota bacterium]
MMERNSVASFVLVSLAAALPAQATFHADAGKALLPADVAVERVAGGFRFVEGPVWRADKQELVFSDIPNNQWLVFAIDSAGCKQWKASEGANGNTLDLQGLVVSCQHGARNVVRHKADGSLEVLVDAVDGKPLNSPNDVAVRSDGSIWFTDPTYGLGQRERQQPGNFVYRFDPAQKRATVVQRDFEMPNGICFAPDQQTLYVADSGKPDRIGAFPVRGDGTLGTATMWFAGGADGIRCDSQGNLWTAARDGVRCYSADGEHLLTLALPEKPANLAFGGPKLDQLFVTARTTLYRVQVAVAGAPVPAGASAGAARKPADGGGEGGGGSGGAGGAKAGGKAK